jgi:hypothetical protein
VTIPVRAERPSPDIWRRTLFRSWISRFPELVLVCPDRRVLVHCPQLQRFERFGNEWILRLKSLSFRERSRTFYTNEPMLKSPHAH